MSATRTSPVAARRPAEHAAVVVADTDTLRGRRLAAALEDALHAPVDRVETCDALVGSEDAPLVIVMRVPDSGSVDRVPRPAAHLRVLALVDAAATARAALAAGAHSAVIDDGVDEHLAAAVAAVAVGHAVVPEALHGRLSRGVLTNREKQILGMVVMGFSNREIAMTLHVTETTVKSHLSSAFRKLHVRSRNEATALILDPETGLGTGILGIS